MDGSSIESVVCCICGKQCAFRSAVRLLLRTTDESDEVQHLYVHKACLRGAIHKSVPLHPDFEGD
jgi:hypothetical protein